MVRVEQISLSRYEVTLQAGETAMPIVSMLPQSASDKSEAWSSSDTSVAVVDDIGNITGVQPGNCTVTVRSVDSPSVFATVTVAVVAKPEEPVSSSEIKIEIHYANELDVDQILLGISSRLDDHLINYQGQEFQECEQFLSSGWGGEQGVIDMITELLEEEYQHYGLKGYSIVWTDEIPSEYEWRHRVDENGNWTTPPEPAYMFTVYKVYSNDEGKDPE